MSIKDEAEARHQGLVYAMFFLLLGLFAGLGTFYQTYMFNIAGVKLTSRLRTSVFKATMDQEMGWFDDARNGVGILCARLAGDCASVQGVSARRRRYCCRFVGSCSSKCGVSFLGFRRAERGSAPSSSRFPPF